MKTTKKQYEDLFVKSSWIYHVWDRGNRRAKKLLDWARQHLDAQWCVRASHQIRDLDLRKRWMKAKLEGTGLPRIVPAVRRHFEKEFQNTYPSRTCSGMLSTGH